MIRFYSINLLINFFNYIAFYIPWPKSIYLAFVIDMDIILCFLLL